MILLYLSHTHSCDIKSKNAPSWGTQNFMHSVFRNCNKSSDRVSQKNLYKVGSYSGISRQTHQYSSQLCPFFGTPCVACTTDQSKQVRRIMHWVTSVVYDVLCCLWCIMLSMMRNLKPNGQSFSKIEVTNLSPFGFVDRCANGEAKYLIIWSLKFANLRTFSFVNMCGEWYYRGGWRIEPPG